MQAIKKDTQAYLPKICYPNNMLEMFTAVGTLRCIKTIRTIATQLSHSL